MNEKIKSEIKTLLATFNAETIQKFIARYRFMLGQAFDTLVEEGEGKDLFSIIFTNSQKASIFLQALTPSSFASDVFFKPESICFFNIKLRYLPQTLYTEAFFQLQLEKGLSECMDEIDVLCPQNKYFGQWSSELASLDHVLIYLLAHGLDVEDTSVFPSSCHPFLKLRTEIDKVLKHTSNKDEFLFTAQLIFNAIWDHEKNLDLSMPDHIGFSCVYFLKSILRDNQFHVFMWLNSIDPTFEFRTRLKTYLEHHLTSPFRNLLQFAVQYNCLYLFNFLVEPSAHINLHQKNYAGESWLRTAARWGSLDVLMLLKERLHQQNEDDFFKKEILCKLHFSSNPRGLRALLEENKPKQLNIDTNDVGKLNADQVMRGSYYEVYFFPALKIVIKVPHAPNDPLSLKDYRSNEPSRTVRLLKELNPSIASKIHYSPGSCFCLYLPSEYAAWEDDTEKYHLNILHVIQKPFHAVLSVKLYDDESQMWHTTEISLALLEDRKEITDTFIRLQNYAKYQKDTVVVHFPWPTATALAKKLGRELEYIRMPQLGRALDTQEICSYTLRLFKTEKRILLDSCTGSNVRQHEDTNQAIIVDPDFAYRPDSPSVEKREIKDYIIDELYIPFLQKNLEKSPRLIRITLALICIQNYAYNAQIELDYDKITEVALSKLFLSRSDEPGTLCPKKTIGYINHELKKMPNLRMFSQVDSNENGHKACEDKKDEDSLTYSP